MGKDSGRGRPLSRCGEEGLEDAAGDRIEGGHLRLLASGRSGEAPRGHAEAEDGGGDRRAEGGGEGQGIVEHPAAGELHHRGSRREAGIDGSA